MSQFVTKSWRSLTANDQDGGIPRRDPRGPDIGEVVTVRSIRTPEVEKAARALVKSIEAAAKNPELERDLAEGQLSSLICSVWNSAERVTRRIPVKRVC